MAYHRVAREDLTTPVARQIRTSILDGTYKPGDLLPPERQLSVQFGVDRNTLRSAIQEIEQLGLVERRQGSGCRVLDYRETATLDLLQYLVIRPGTNQVDAEMLRSAADLSAMTFRGIFALVVERSTPKDFAAIQQALDVLRSAVDADDDQEVYDAYIGVIRQFVRAAHSPAGELVLNTYNQVAIAAFDPEGTLEPHLGRLLIDQNQLKAYEVAAAALERGDPKAAQRLTDAMLGVLPGLLAAEVQRPRKATSAKRTARPRTKTA